ncbi:MAG: Uma2 family endonuclease [Candidatus Xenobia bacterium]
MKVVFYDEFRDVHVTIPESAGDLQGFREWMASDAFPERGRIDFLQGTIEVDMTPEHLQSHGQPKVKLCNYISNVVGDHGQVFSDRSRVTHPAVGLSCEPDIVYVSLEALQSGRVRYEAFTEGSERLMEIVGAATLVVEIVSDSSVGKDLKRLPDLYAQAGVEELWLLDARGRTMKFEVRHLANRQWEVATPDSDGFVTSRVLSRRLKVERKPWEMPNTWSYAVTDKPLSA